MGGGLESGTELIDRKRWALSELTKCLKAPARASVPFIPVSAQCLRAPLARPQG